MIDKLIRPIVIKDIEYLVNNYDKVSFDLWEEKEGLAFLYANGSIKVSKDCLKLNKYLKLDGETFAKVGKVVNELFVSLEDHTIL